MVDDNAPVAAGAQAAEKPKRILSEIEFPYVDLESAVELAAVLHSRAGASCEDAELAAWLNQTPTGGGYRSRKSAARMFGLIETAQSRVSLTPMGREAIDGRDARVEAFLRPELHRAMYDQFRGQILPPPAAIERHMEQIGVSPRQKDRARQVFQKSAVYAGYIDQPTGRFIRPGNGPDAERHTAEAHKRSGGGGSDDGDNPPEIDPIIKGLLARLPKSGDVWPETERKLWLDLLAGSFKLIYRDAPSPSTAGGTGHYGSQDGGPENG